MYQQPATSIHFSLLKPEDLKDQLEGPALEAHLAAGIREKRARESAIDRNNHIAWHIDNIIAKRAQEPVKATKVPYDTLAKLMINLELATSKMEP